MSGISAHQTIGSGQSSLIDMHKQAIGHIIQKINLVFAYSCIQMMYDLHTFQSSHEKIISCN